MPFVDPTFVLTPVTSWRRVVQPIALSPTAKSSRAPAKACGALNRKRLTKGSWLLYPTMDEVLVGPSGLRLEELRIDDWPARLFDVPPRGMEASCAWLGELFKLSSLVNGWSLRGGNDPA